MEIIKLTSGQVQDKEIRFSEGIFGNDDVQFYIFAIESGELILLVRSDLSLDELMDNVREDDEFDLEDLLAYCMESDMERYECWDGDGNEGLYEASEADDGLAFVITYDLLAENDFENVRTMAENGDEEAEALLPVLEDVNNSDEE